ncbi:DUF4138 domain-containing protein [Flagellimonas sp. S3867]|uniref:DUF4138 domain-containing protein n=1 Tax=Flagellimonas sp. S3867 TaxID=2768063 RepID=UPI001685DF15|nr:DUF4138 domain-containing protein [Flagellimonas sp. S3867]
MRRIFIILGSLLTVIAQASNNRTLDTIYANEHMNMALFFPSEIKQGIVGNSNFVFTYNREKQQTLGLLKAVPGKDSNLLVITDDGSIYSYIIRYAKELQYPNRFITEPERIGTERQGMGITSRKEVPRETVRDSSVPVKRVGEKFLESCDALLRLPKRKNIKKKTKGLSLAVTNMYHMENGAYVQFEVRNSSGTQFEFGELELYKVSGERARKASFQELELMPIYKHNIPEKIDHGQTASFVYVLPRFHLDKREKLRAVLSERSTNRMISLKFIDP